MIIGEIGKGMVLASPFMEREKGHSLDHSRKMMSM